MTPSNMLGRPPDRSQRDEGDSAPRSTVVINRPIHRTYDINAWLLLLVVVLALPAGCFIYEQYQGQLIRLEFPWSGSSNGPSAAEIVQPVRDAVAARDAALASASPSQPAATVSAAPPSETSAGATPEVVTPALPKKVFDSSASAKPSAALRMVRYKIGGGANSSYYVNFTNQDGKSERRLVNNGWQLTVPVKVGTSVELSVSTDSSGLSKLSAEVYLDGVLWRHDERTARRVRVSVGGVVPATF